MASRSGWDRGMVALTLIGMIAALKTVSSSCPPGPHGYSSLPGHCIGLPGGAADQQRELRSSVNCASSAPWQIEHGQCNGTLTQCSEQLAARCDAITDCHSFAFHSHGPDCTGADQQQWFQLFRLGQSSAVENPDWISFAKPGNGSLPPAPAPRPPRPPTNGPGSDIPQHSDCAIRRLALQFATGLLPTAMQASAPPLIFDGLELATRCNDTRPHVQPPIAPNLDLLKDQSYARSDSDTVVYVDYSKGSDLNPGTVGSPVKTALHGLELLRRAKSVRASSKALVLRAGVHYLNQTLALTAVDSGITIRNYPPDAPEIPWLSGAVPLASLKWSKASAAQFASGSSSSHSNVWEASLGEVPGMTEALKDVHSLRLPDADGRRRGTAARYPNADIELDRFPTGYIQKAQAWDAPRKFEAANVISIDSPSRTHISNQYTNYKLGLAGPASIFDPPVSFWAKGTNGFTPSGVQLKPEDARNWTDPVKDGAEVFAWRSGHWNNWMFTIDAFDPETRNITFGRGGFQGTRPGGAQEFYISHVKDELDAPNEYFIDRSRPGGMLLLVPNCSAASARQVVLGRDSDGCAPSKEGFVLTRLRTLLSMNGSAAQPIRNITVTGVGFRDARATYMDPHGVRLHSGSPFSLFVPSGGDWALQRSAAIFLDHTESVTVANSTIERCDGNAIMVSGHNLQTRITSNEIRWTGDSAIAAWGRTPEQDPPHYGQLAADDHPVELEVSHNLIHELGAFEKQSSMLFLAKSCSLDVHHNVFFGGPRAGININDGFCGGHRIFQNIVFNTCRESGDHGPLNSWDRQPFSMSAGALPVPAVTDTFQNFIFADYQGVKALDHDDGSSFFFDHSNVIYMGWGQKTFEPAPGNKTASDSLILFTDSVLTEHGGETSTKYAEKFRNNTIVFKPGKANYGSVDSEVQLTQHLLQLHGNHFFTSGEDLQLAVGKNGTKNLADLQALGVEQGSTITKNLPTDDEIVSMAKATLQPHDA